MKNIKIEYTIENGSIKLVAEGSINQVEKHLQVIFGKEVEHSDSMPNLNICGTPMSDDWVSKIINRKENEIPLDFEQKIETDKNTLEVRWKAPAKQKVIIASVHPRFWNDKYRLSDLMELFNTSEPSIYAWMSKGKLPRPDGKEGIKNWWFKSTINNLPLAKEKSLEVSLDQAPEPQAQKDNNFVEKLEEFLDNG